MLEVVVCPAHCIPVQRTQIVLVVQDINRPQCSKESVKLMLWNPHVAINSRAETDCRIWLFNMKSHNSFRIHERMSAFIFKNKSISTLHSWREKLANGEKEEGGSRKSGESRESGQELFFKWDPRADSNSFLWYHTHYWHFAPKEALQHS